MKEQIFIYSCSALLAFTLPMKMLRSLRFLPVGEDLPSRFYTIPLTEAKLQPNINSSFPNLTSVQVFI